MKTKFLIAGLTLMSATAYSAVSKQQQIASMKNESVANLALTNQMGWCNLRTNPGTAPWKYQLNYKDIAANKFKKKYFYEMRLQPASFPVQLQTIQGQNQTSSVDKNYFKALGQILKSQLWIADAHAVFPQYQLAQYTVSERFNLLSQAGAFIKQQVAAGGCGTNFNFEKNIVDINKMSSLQFYRDANNNILCSATELSKEYRNPQNCSISKARAELDPKICLRLYANFTAKNKARVPKNPSEAPSEGASGLPQSGLGNVQASGATLSAAVEFLPYTEAVQQEFAVAKALNDIDLVAVSMSADQGTVKDSLPVEIQEFADSVPLTSAAQFAALSADQKDKAIKILATVEEVKAEASSFPTLGAELSGYSVAAVKNAILAYASANSISAVAYSVPKKDEIGVAYATALNPITTHLGHAYALNLDCFEARMEMAAPAQAVQASQLSVE